MQKRNLRREFKLEAVRLVKERGVAVAQTKSSASTIPGDGTRRWAI